MMGAIKVASWLAADGRMVYTVNGIRYMVGMRYTVYGVPCKGYI